MSWVLPLSVFIAACGEPELADFDIPRLNDVSTVVEGENINQRWVFLP